MKNKIFLLIKISFLILLLYYFNKFINTEKFLKVFNNLNFIDLIFLLLLYLIFFILVTLRWTTVIKNFTKTDFFYFFKNIILGYNIAIFSTTLAVDATKFYGLNKKIDSSRAFALVIYDKFFTLFFKIIFLITVFNYLNFIKYKFYENLILIFSLFIILFFVIFIKNINFYLKYLLKFKLFKFLGSIDEIILKNKNIIQKLIFNNLIVQLQFIIMYYYSFKIFLKDIDLLEVSLLTPLIEIIGILQTLMIGIIEFSTVLLYSILDFSNENILAASLTLRFTELLITISIYLISINIKKSNKIKKN